MKPDPIQDAALSWAARGLYAYLSTLPRPIHETVAHLTEINRNGRDVTNHAIHELETHGYLVRKQDRSRGRVTGTLWTLTGPESKVKP